MAKKKKVEEVLTVVEPSVEVIEPSVEVVNETPVEILTPVIEYTSDQNGDPIPVNVTPEIPQVITTIDAIKRDAFVYLNRIQTPENGKKLNIQQCIEKNDFTQALSYANTITTIDTGYLRQLINRLKILVNNT